MNKVRLACLFATVALSTAASAQLQKVLLPVTATPGGYGSLWNTTLAVRNGSAVPIHVFYGGSPQQNPFGMGGDFELPPEHTRIVPVDWHSRDTAGQGRIVFINTQNRNILDAVGFNYRLWESTRQSLTAGVEIPVVRERDLFAGTLHLINIPTDERFRSALRVYDFDGPASEVRVRIFAIDNTSTPAGPTAQPEPPLAETTVALIARECYPEGCGIPGQAVIGDLLMAFPQLPRDAPLRIQIEPLTPGLRFWAFASVAHKETQHVTLVTPQ